MKDKLRIAIIIETLRPGGGTENQLILLLRRFDRRRIEPRVICLRTNPEIERLEVDCPVQVLGLTRLRSPGGVIKLFRLAGWLRRERTDLALTFFRDANLVGTIAGWLAGVPMISNRRSLGYWQHRWDPWLLRAIRPLTSAWIANSNAARQHAIEVEGVRPDRVRVIVNAIDLDRFSPHPAADSEEASAGLTEGVRFVCVANLRPVKQHSILLEAFARAREQIGAASLLLIGEGDERARLERQAESLGIARNVQFLGRRSDVAELLADCDVGVLASSSESSSNAVLEYLACGLPVVATDVGGNGELVRDGVHGWLTRPGDVQSLADAMVQIGRNPERRKEMAASARATCQTRHAPDVVLAQWQVVFDQVVSDHQASSARLSRKLPPEGNR